VRVIKVWLPAEPGLPVDRAEISSRLHDGLKNPSSGSILSVPVLNAITDEITDSHKSNSRHEQHFKFFKEAE
jgi:hypothetical protein